MTLARWLLALAMAGAVWLSFSAPDAVGFLEPRLARIIFFHLPCAIIATLFFFAGSYLSFRYMRTREWRFDVAAASANEMGLVLAVVTMATGILFSKMQWGAWWQWDPRQTSFLLVLFLFAGYFVLRASFSDERRRAANSAAYSVAALLPSIFLIFVFPRLPHVQQVSFHPSQTIQSGGFDRTYSLTLWTIGVLLFVLACWMYRIRVRACMAELALEDRIDSMDDRGSTADSGVVRPVPISHED